LRRLGHEVTVVDRQASAAARVDRQANAAAKVDRQSSAAAKVDCQASAAAKVDCSGGGQIRRLDHVEASDDRGGFQLIGGDADGVAVGSPSPLPLYSLEKDTARSAGPMLANPERALPGGSPALSPTWTLHSQGLTGAAA